MTRTINHDHSDILFAESITELSFDRLPGLAIRSPDSRSKTTLRNDTLEFLHQFATSALEGFVDGAKE